MRAEHKGHGAEQWIGRRADAPDRRLLVERDRGAIGRADHPHMIIARRDVRRVGDHGRAVVGLHHVELGQRVEALREGPREIRRHVLHHEHGGAPPRRKPRDQLGERAGAAGRRGHGHGELGPRAEPRFGHAAGGHRRPGHHGDAGHIGREGASHRGAQLGTHAQQRRAVPFVGLGDDLDCAQLQRADRGTGPGPRVRADHHDRARRLRHDVADRAQAVELGHLEVHGHDIGIELMHLADRVESVAGGPHDAELAVPRGIRAAQHVAQHASQQRAVIHDENARPPIRGR